jgi:hypothetical protein
MLLFHVGREKKMRRVATFTLLFLLGSQNYAQSAWDVAAPMPTARMDAATAVVDDTLYVMGGRQSETASGSGNEGFVDVVEAYVPLTDNWLTGYPPLPNPAALQACTVVGRHIYLLGGLAPESQTLDCIWHWEPGEPIWAEGAGLPSSVEGAAAVTLPDGNILLIGGLTADGEYVDDVLIVSPGNYDFVDAPELNQARAAAGAVLVSDVVLVTGGYFYGPMGNCEIFGGVTWGTGPELPRSTGSHVACVFEGTSYVIGGEGHGGALAEVFSLNSFHGEWVPLDELMSIPRIGLAGGVAEGFLVAAGGIGSEGSMALDSVERLELSLADRSPMDPTHPFQPSLEIALWPNPVSTHFAVNAELGVNESWEMLLYSPTGQRVWSTSGVSQSVRLVACPVRNLANGMYFLSLQTATQQTTIPVTVVE